MMIIEKNVENNRQILKQLQKSLIANSKRFEKMRIDAIKVMNAMHVMGRLMSAVHSMKRRSHLNGSTIESISAVSGTFDSENSKRDRIPISAASGTFDSENSRNSEHSIEQKSDVTFIE